MQENKRKKKTIKSVGKRISKSNSASDKVNKNT